MGDPSDDFAGNEPPTPILIVDDNAFFREGLATILLREGYSVIQAGNGKQALDHLQCCARPAVILLDMFMPGMDGWSFVRQCRQRSLPLPPVVIMTGLDIASDEWANGLGASGLLRKPFVVETLLKEVGRHC